MKKSHNIITKQKQNPIKKWAEDDPNKHFPKEDVQMADRFKILYIIYYQGNANHNFNEISLHIYQKGHCQ